jgi:hypothetical protein
MRQLALQGDLMQSLEDIRARADKLLKERKVLEEQVEKLGGGRAETAAYVYGKMRELVSEMKGLDAKSAEMDNADIATRIKFSQKAKKAGKEFWRLIREINGLHEKGELEESTAKKFGSVL